MQVHTHLNGLLFICHKVTLFQKLNLILPKILQVTHQILVSSDMVNWNVVDTFTSFTTNSVAFERTFANPIPNVRGVRVLTTSSPSWVAWFEIEVFGN